MNGPAYSNFVGFFQDFIDTGIDVNYDEVELPLVEDWTQKLLCHAQNKT